MKMVAAAKYARAERALKPARVYGTSAMGMQDIIHKNALHIAQYSDIRLEPLVIV